MKKVIFPKSATVVRGILKSAELTQEQLGTMFGYTRAQFVSNNARGLSAFPPKHWRRLAKIGGIDVEELIRAYLEDKENQIREVVSEG